MLSIDFFASVTLILFSLGLLGSLVFIKEKPKLFVKSEKSSSSPQKAAVKRKNTKSF